MSMHERRQIDSGHARHHAAPLRPRFVASMIDTVIVGVAVLAGVVMSGLPAVLRYLPWLLAMTWWMFHDWGALSPGNRTANLEVVRLDGRPITMWQSLLRNCVEGLPRLWKRCVAMLLGVAPNALEQTHPTVELVLTLLGALIALTDFYLLVTRQDRRMLGDFLGGTYVRTRNPA